MVRRSKCQQPNPPPPPPPSRSFFACLSQPPRFLSFCQNKARRRAALRPQFVQRALCMPTALQQQLAAVFIPSACPSQASPPPPPPAPSNINASRMFLLTQRAPRVQCAFSPQLLRSAAGILHRARGILFRATAAARAFHLRSHITATGKACSGDRATSSWAAAAATQSVTLEHHARTAATHWHPRPPTPLGSPCPAAAACPSQDVRTCI